MTIPNPPCLGLLCLPIEFLKSAMLGLLASVKEPWVKDTEGLKKSAIVSTESKPVTNRSVGELIPD